MQLEFLAQIDISKSGIGGKDRQNHRYLFGLENQSVLCLLAPLGERNSTAQTGDNPIKINWQVCLRCKGIFTWASSNYGEFR